MASDIAELKSIVIELIKALKESKQSVVPTTVGYKSTDPISGENALAYANFTLGTTFQPSDIQFCNPTVLIEVAL